MAKWFISYQWRHPSSPTALPKWDDEVSDLPPDQWVEKWRRENIHYPVLVVCAVPLPEGDAGNG